MSDDKTEATPSGSEPVRTEMGAQDNSQTDAVAAPTPASRITPIRVLIGVAFLAACYSSYGAYQRITAPPYVVFPVIEDMTSLSEGIEAAKAADVLVEVTRGDGVIDIIYAGTPECIYCTGFMKAEFDGFEAIGFDAMVQQAEARGLDLSYMPMGNGQLGAFIASAGLCVAQQGGTLPGQDRVRKSYEAHEMLNAASAAARKLAEAQAPIEEIEAVLFKGRTDLFALFGKTDGYDEACHQEAFATIVERTGDFTDVFGTFGTPAFFFNGDEGVVNSFAGAMGVEPMMRQVVE